MEYETLLEEYAAGTLGPLLYAELRDTAGRVVLGRGYPLSYSPTGRWDEDAFSGLAHDWIVDKLLARGQLNHLLLANSSTRGLRIGLELSFVQFLLGQKQRTARDNLFARANELLEEDDQFRCVDRRPRKARRPWGLAVWEASEPFDGTDGDLIEAGLRIQDVAVIRYRESARKLSPVISDRDLTRFLRQVLEDLGATITLEQFSLIFAYRFALLDARVSSLDATLEESEKNRGATLTDTMSSGDDVEGPVLVAEAVASILRVLTPRQGQVLLAYAAKGATLTTVAADLGCSRSTVDNELRRGLATIGEHTEGAEEAEATYVTVLEKLAGGLDNRP